MRPWPRRGPARAAETWLLAAVLAAAVLFDLHLLLHPIPERIGGVPLFVHRERALLMPYLAAGWLAWASLGLVAWSLLPRSPGWPAAALFSVALVVAATAAVEADLRRRVLVETRPSAWLLWELKPGAMDNNRWGMAYGDVPEDPAPGEYRFLVLGDSSAWGHRIRHPDLRFSDHLERRLVALHPGRTVRVMNAAVPGYSTFQMKESLARKYLGLQPDCLILATNSDWVLEPTPDPDRLPAPWQRPLLESLYHLESYLCLVQSLRGTMDLDDPRRRGDPGAGRPRVSAEESGRNLEEMIRRVRERGGTALVVNMPMHPTFRPLVPFREADLAAFQESAREAARRQGVPFVDAFAEWRRRPGSPDPLFLDFVHPSPAGHELLAERLLREITSGRVSLEAAPRRRAAD